MAKPKSKFDIGQEQQAQQEQIRKQAFENVKINNLVSILYEKIARELDCDIDAVAKMTITIFEGNIKIDNSNNL